ncbi:type IIL restriction-modification enzyme MmeI, partial [Macrococcoides caseolyticum]|uniref:type IIL restriction-modification enzyme MmeI n=1 Tax=Macrococcoides caseolyticum TaxID=69966 RepID=UPI003F644EE5
KKQISNYPKMIYGSMANDNKGKLQLNKEEKDEIVRKYPYLEEYIHLFIGSEELINGIEKYILYLKDMPINLMRKNPEIQKRLESIRETRLKSSRDKTKELANYPYALGEDRVIKDSKFLIIPRVSSEKREYIPIDYFEYPTIVSDAAFQLENASLYILGVLHSKMHALWLKTVGGKLESRYRYSNTLVYNNFVFPKVNKKEEEKIENIVQQLLCIRNDYLKQGNTLADLYDTNYMPIDLRKKHTELDKAIEKLYKKTPFKDDNERISHMIDLYISNRE